MKVDWGAHDWGQMNPVSDPAGGNTARDGFGDAALQEARLPARGRSTHGKPGRLESA